MSLSCLIFYFIFIRNEAVCQRSPHVVCRHLAARQVSPECSLAADGQATAVQQRHHHDCQTHDETSQHSAYYSCNVRTGKRHVSRSDAKDSRVQSESKENEVMMERYYAWSLPPVEGATDLSAVRRASMQSLKDGPVHLEKKSDGSVHQKTHIRFIFTQFQEINTHNAQLNSWRS